MVKQIVWSLKAKEDKKEILNYWVQRNKSKKYSIKLNVLFQDAVKWISANPNIRRMTDMEGVYIKMVRDYQIIFEEDQSSIYILCIWDTRQNPEKLKSILGNRE